MSEAGTDAAPDVLSSADAEPAQEQQEQQDSGEEGSHGSAKPTDPAALAAAIRKQIEFYFSDANLPTDKHLLKQIHKDPEGYVPLKMIANFKRVKALTKEVSVVAAALHDSSLVALDDSGSRIRRATALPAFDVTDITRRTVVAEHLPDKPTIEGVTQLLSQYGEVALVRICARGNNNRLPGWLSKAVEAINLNVGHGEYALVEFASEEDCVNCVNKTKNPDNWRTSLRVRHLLPNFKPSSSKGSRPGSAAGECSHHGTRQHSGAGSSNSAAGGSRPQSRNTSRRSSIDGGHQQHKEHREHAAAAAAAAAAAMPVGLSPIRTHAAGDAGQRAASPYGNGSSRTGAVSPAVSSPVKGSTGVGGAIGSPRAVKSPAPAEVASLIDSILSAPTGNTPTRGSSGGGSSAARWTHTSAAGGSSSNDWGAGSSTSPAAAVAAALAGVSTPPQANSPRAAAGASSNSTFRPLHHDPRTPTRLSAGSSAAAAAATPTTPATVQSALAAQLAAAAAAAASAAMNGSPRAAAAAAAASHGINAASWRSGAGAANSTCVSVSAPVTPLGGISAGDAVEAALADMDFGGGSSSTMGFTPGSPDLSGSAKAGAWIPPSRLHRQHEARSGSEAEDNGGSWRSSWSGGGPGSGQNKPPKPRSSGGGGHSSRNNNRERRRSWHAEGDESGPGAATASGSSFTDGSSDDGGSGSLKGGSNKRSGGRSRLGEYRSTIEMIKEGSQEFDPALLATVASPTAAGAGAAAAAAAAVAGLAAAKPVAVPGGGRRRSASYAGDGGGGGAEGACAEGEHHEDECEEGDGFEAAGGKKHRQRRRRSTGSRRASLDEGGGSSRRQSLDEGHGSKGGGNKGGRSSRRQSSEQGDGGHHGSSHSRPHSRAGAATPEDGKGHGRPHSGAGSGHHGSPGDNHSRSNHGGDQGKDGKKKEKKDYANWAAATPEFRAAAAAGKHCGAGAGAAGSNMLGTSPIRGGLSPLRGSGGGAAAAAAGQCPGTPTGLHTGHDGDSHVRIARMPDGSRGFGAGRGRPLTPPPA